MDVDLRLTAVYDARRVTPGIARLGDDLPDDHYDNVERIVRDRTSGDEVVLFAHAREGTRLDAMLRAGCRPCASYGSSPTWTSPGYAGAPLKSSFGGNRACQT